jgi:hemerythrin-like domain-containing protein
MNRAPVLRDLSSEHHRGLVLVRRIRKAFALPESQPAVIWADMIDRFEHELEPHFKKEEQGLLPALRAAGEHALVERTLREHWVMRDMVEEANPERLPHFADLLSDHIRFEERVLFEVAQRRLSTDQLATLSP